MENKFDPTLESVEFSYTSQFNCYFCKEGAQSNDVPKAEYCFATQRFSLKTGEFEESKKTYVCKGHVKQIESIIAKEL